MEKNIENFWDDFGRAFSSRLTVGKKLDKPVEVHDRVAVADFLKTQLDILMLAATQEKDRGVIETIEKEVIVLERMEKRLLSGDIDAYAIKEFMKSVDAVSLAVDESSLKPQEKKNIKQEFLKMKRGMGDKFEENQRVVSKAKELYKMISRKIEKVSEGKAVTQEELDIATAAMVFIIRHHPYMSSSAEEIRDENDNVVKYELLASKSLFEKDPILTAALGVNKSRFIEMLNHSELGHVNIEYSLAHIRNYLSSDLFGKTGLPVSVNISETELKNSNYLEELAKISVEHLENGEFLGKYIQYELLESSIAFSDKDVGDGLVNLIEVKKSEVGLDDFGAGESTEVRLADLRVLKDKRGMEKEIVSFIKFDQRVISLNTINEVFENKYSNIKKANEGIAKHLKNILTEDGYSVDEKLINEVVAEFVGSKGLDGLKGGYKACLKMVAERASKDANELIKFMDNEELEAIDLMIGVIKKYPEKVYIAEHVDMESVRAKVQNIGQKHGVKMLVQGFMFEGSNIPHQTQRATEEEIGSFFEITNPNVEKKENKKSVFNPNER